MIFGRKPCLSRIALVLVAALLSACGSRQVMVQGEFPRPLMEPLPLTLGVIYSEAFANHEFFDEAAGKAESDWLVRTGEAQVAFWDTLFGGMFERVIHIQDHDTLHEYEHTVDAVIVPYVEELQYTIPLHTNVKIYEVWMRYRFRLSTVDEIHDHANGALTYHPAHSFADWTLTAYGKTPTAFLQSDEEAVNLAAVVALRDAGANFITSFERVPDVAAWLDRRKNQPTPKPDTETRNEPDAMTAGASDTVEAPK